MTPVTVTPLSSPTLMILPMGSSAPKSFLAISSVITMEKAAERAVRGAPLMRGNEKMSKTFPLL
jgi:hypothetical protein